MSLWKDGESGFGMDRFHAWAPHPKKPHKNIVITKVGYHPIIFSSDKCTRCGRSGHYNNACHASFDISGQPLSPPEKHSS